MKIDKALLLFWDITNRCNLDCEFCMWSWHYSYNYHEVSRDQKEYILNEIIANKPLKIVLTGGEPLLVQGIFDYITRLKKADIFIEMTTNGTLLNEYTVSNLKEAGIDKIQVSIHGSSEELNDEIMRGKAYNNILTGMDLLNKYKIRFKTKTTVTSKNIDDLGDLMILLEGSGAEQINFSEYIPMGAAYINDDELKIPMNKLRFWKDKLNREFGNAVNFDSLTLDAYEIGHPRKCSIGDENSYLAQILWDGTVVQCALMSVFEIDNNIFKYGLKQCWNNFSKFQHFNLPLSQMSGCKECNYIDECNGGCKGLAFVKFNSVDMPDPRCEIIHNNKIKKEKVRNNE